MKTRMKMKALQGAATLQVAMVTSTDWSSNGNSHLGGVTANLRVGQVGLRAQAEHSAIWVLGSCGGIPQGEAGPFEGKEDGEGPSGMSVYSLKGTEKLKPKAP
ncbi:hypothetical protein HispidOSU_031701 [Sigmodon hispidus]